jgi:hypothetical protein
VIQFRTMDQNKDTFTCYVFSLGNLAFDNSICRPYFAQYVLLKTAETTGCRFLKLYYKLDM